MKIKKIQNPSKIKTINADMLDLGQYCLIATGCGHDGRVAQLRDYNKLVLLTAGSTYIGDYFSVPFHIKVKPISAKHAHSLIKKSNK